jgi:hypothetical protein
MLILNTVKKGNHMFKLLTLMLWFTTLDPYFGVKKCKVYYTRFTTLDPYFFISILHSLVHILFHSFFFANWQNIFFLHIQKIEF